MFLPPLGVIRSHCLEAGVLEQTVVPMVTSEGKFSLFLGTELFKSFCGLPD